MSAAFCYEALEQGVQAKGLYTAVWPCGVAPERKWLLDVFAPYLSGEVVDSDRTHAPIDHAIVFDIFINANPRQYYEQYRGRDAILVDMRDENYDSDPAIYSCFRGVIRNHWSDVFKPETVMFLPLGYTGDFERVPFPPASERRYVWSFVGAASKSTRPDVVKHLSEVEPHFCFSSDDLPGKVMWNVKGDQPKRLSTAENGAVLRDSIFCPSPMGNVNLDCFRLYEALEAGAIPIVEKRLTLDYFHEALGDHPLPTVRDWSEARALIADLVTHTEDLDALQKRCFEWWENYRIELRAEVGRFLARRSADTRVLSESDFVHPKRFRWWWQMAELLRHHDLRAALRRLNTMATRLLAGNKMRVYHGLASNAK